MLSDEGLTRTKAEQSIFRAIEALKQEFALSSGERRKELEMQIEELSNQLELLSMPDSLSLLKKNRELEEKLESEEKKSKDLEDKVSRYSKGQRSLADSHAMPEASLFSLYQLLLEKYAGIINDFEKKTVGELKALINPEDLTVQGIANQFKPELFIFERDYLVTARKAFEFIQNEIQFVKPTVNINFWLSANEIMRHKVGDDTDLAVLLCSVLCFLGDRNAEVVIAEMDNRSSHAFVISEFHGRFVLLDPSQKKHFNEFIGEKIDVLKKYSFEGAKIKEFLYRFNREKYEQFV